MEQKNAKTQLFSFFLAAPQVIAQKSITETSSFRVIFIIYLMILIVIQSKIQSNYQTNTKQLSSSNKWKVLSFFGEFPSITYSKTSTSIQTFESNFKGQLNNLDKEPKVSRKKQMMLFFQESPKIIILQTDHSFINIQDSINKKINSPTRKIVGFLKASPHQILETTKSSSKELKVIIIVLSSVCL